MTLDELNGLDLIGFLACLGGVFEHSPWVAERAYSDRPFGDCDTLHGALMRAVRRASEAEQIALLRAHPDLAGKAARAGTLTADSTAEQAGAALDKLTDSEFDRFHALNTAYTARFGFPFILAVKGHDKTSILAAFERRLENSAEEERETAIEQVGRIARFRLDALLDAP